MILHNGVGGVLGHGCFGHTPTALVGRGLFGSLKTREAKGAGHGSTDDRSPLASLGSETSFQVFERTLSNGFRVLVLPRTHALVVVSGTSTIRVSARSTSRRANVSGWHTSSSTCSSRGYRTVPEKGEQIDRSCRFVAAGHSRPRPAEDSTHYWIRLPVLTDGSWRAGEVEADRMRGAIFDAREVRSRAAGHRRGAAWA